jgi:hypothetical protein
MDMTYTGATLCSIGMRYMEWKVECSRIAKVSAFVCAWSLALGDAKSPKIKQDVRFGIAHGIVEADRRKRQGPRLYQCVGAAGLRGLHGSTDPLVKRAICSVLQYWRSRSLH